jgi:hypothetical protein
MRLVVDATEERIAVEGFKLSAETDSTAGLDKAWEMWQANDMDAQSQTAILEALTKGVSYLSVWADDDKDGFADICVEDPLQTIVAYEAGSNYRRREAALKVWLDENAGVRRANVYLPDGIYKFKAPPTVPSQRESTPREQIQITWEEIPDSFVRNPLWTLRGGGVVPIIPLRNRPRLLIEGESEIADVIPGPEPDQRAALPDEPRRLRRGAPSAVGSRNEAEAGRGRKRDIEPFDPSVAKLWQTENPDVKFGEFGQTDLTGYIKAIDQPSSTSPSRPGRRATT